MTFGHSYTNWQVWPISNVGKSYCSPNLMLVVDELQQRWPFRHLGCYGRRPVRGGTKPSSHSWGAAVDIGYEPATDVDVERLVCPFLVAWSHELHLSAIHDYRRSRIWHAGRTEHDEDACSTWWRAQKPSSATGMGQAWCNHLHLEVTAEGWSDTTPLVARARDLALPRLHTP